jgi:hypothetical protein
MKKIANFEQRLKKLEETGTPSQKYYVVFDGDEDPIGVSSKQVIRFEVVDKI